MCTDALSEAGCRGHRVAAGVRVQHELVAGAVVAIGISEGTHPEMIDSFAALAAARAALASWDEPIAAWRIERCPLRAGGAECPFHVISSGIGVRHQLDERGGVLAIGAVFGGQRERLELDPVIAAARAGLAPWPERISQIDVVVEDRK